jgi:two-component system copper resistance phosphate regulon response regulator CusR
MSHILIIEDEERMAATLRKGLEKEDFKVSIISNGLAARVTNITNYDLVLLDWMLPGVSGIDLLHHWRKLKYSTPIIMLTARDGLTDTVTGLDFGADDYISKFFKWPELIARINSLLRRTRTEANLVKGIEFDRTNQIFLEDSIPVNLTATEFNILKYFFDHPNALITRTSLLLSVYQDSKETFSNVIERHIKSIRQKFNYDPISTIRGLGYRLRSSSSVQSHKD